ncbi:COPII coat Sec23p-Sfb3p heterodimer component, partial [Ascosphaera atra]
PIAPAAAPYGYATSPSPQPQAYAQAASPLDPAMAGLAGQMAGMGLGNDPAAATYAQRQQKKKHRHAYHDIGTAVGTSQAFNGMPQGYTQSESQFLDARAQQGAQLQPGSASPYSPQPIQSPHMTPTSVHTQQGKVDPEQIPSVPSSRDAAYQYYLANLYPTMEHHLPPPATVPFIAHDQGNSSPKFARLTLNNIPATADQLAMTALPLGMILQPLAQLDPAEQGVPVLDFGEMGPPRCRRCRAYMNPFMTFRSNGNKFVCNMCTFPSDVPPEYFAPLDHTGVRVDRLQRPELMLGTVEYVVPKQFQEKEPTGLRWLFLIDVTQEAVSRGFLDAICDGILAALYGGDATVRMGRTYTPRPNPRLKLAYALLDTLFELSSTYTGSAEAAPYVKLAEATLPYLILRVAISLKTYIADQPLRGLMPQPTPSQKELLYLVDRSTCLDSEPSAIPDPSTIGPASSNGSTKKHLAWLRPLVLRGIDVAGKESDGCEVLVNLTKLLKTLDEDTRSFTKEPNALWATSLHSEGLATLTSPGTLNV